MEAVENEFLKSHRGLGAGRLRYSHLHHPLQVEHDCGQMRLEGISQPAHVATSPQPMILLRLALPPLRRECYADAQLAPEALEVLVETLRHGLRPDRATVSDTLRRVVTKVEVRKDRGTPHVIVQCAVLSAGTAGATRAAAHGSGRCPSIPMAAKPDATPPQHKAAGLGKAPARPPGTATKQWSPQPASSSHAPPLA